MYMDDIKLSGKNEKEMENLIQTVRIYIQDIGIEFGIEKYTMLTMSSGKRHMPEGIELPNQVKKNQKIKQNSWKKETKKYLGILEADTIKYEEMEEKIRKQYLKRMRKPLETKIHRRNIKEINAWAASLVRYSGSFLKWTREELKQINQKIKLMMIHKALHPRDDVDRLYVSWREGGRGIAGIEDSVSASLQRLEVYIKKKHKGRLITATRNNTDNTSINRIKITRKQRCKEKQLYGHLKRQTNKISHEKTWTWLRKENLKKENESLLITAQNYTIRIRTMSKHE